MHPSLNKHTTKVNVYRVDFTYLPADVSDEEGVWNPAISEEPDCPEPYWHVCPEAAAEQIERLRKRTRDLGSECLPRLKVTDLGKTHEIWVTTHPKSYDYGYTIEVHNDFGLIGNKRARVVAVQSERARYQVGRWDSDMTCVAMPWAEFWAEAALEEGGICWCRSLTFDDLGHTCDSRAVSRMKALLESDASSGLPVPFPTCAKCGRAIIGMRDGLRELPGDVEHPDGNPFVCDNCYDDTMGPQCPLDDEQAAERRQMGLVDR